MDHASPDEISNTTEEQMVVAITSYAIAWLSILTGILPPQSVFNINITTGKLTEIDANINRVCFDDGVRSGTGAFTKVGYCGTECSYIVEAHKSDNIQKIKQLGITARQSYSGKREGVNHRDRKLEIQIREEMELMKMKPTFPRWLSRYYLIKLLLSFRHFMLVSARKKKSSIVFHSAEAQDKSQHRKKTDTIRGECIRIHHPSIGMPPNH